jgi:hypothetical protein
MLNAYVSGLRAEYRRAADLIRMARAEIDAFDLEFARPHANWSLAFIELGLRRFGAAERALRLVEDETSEKPLGYHVLNARVLRARLALQTGQEMWHLSSSDVLTSKQQFRRFMVSIWRLAPSS